MLGLIAILITSLMVIYLYLFKETSIEPINDLLYNNEKIEMNKYKITKITKDNSFMIKIVFQFDDKEQFPLEFGISTEMDTLRINVEGTEYSPKVYQIVKPFEGVTADYRRDRIRLYLPEKRFTIG